MTTPDLQALESLTRDYAAFQARKSGLATALGGLMAVVLAIAALSPDLMGVHAYDHWLIEYLLWIPLAWLVLKSAIGRRLYHSLGPVKPLPNTDYERRRWFWILGLALFVIAVLAMALGAFAMGFLQLPGSGACPAPPALWVLAMPLVYLLPMPWAVRGVEEARVYAVLVGQCILWLVPAFLFSFGNPTPPLKTGWGLFGDLTGIGLVVLIGTIQIWGALAMVRGWKEHRGYLALLRSLPQES